VVERETQKLETGNMRDLTHLAWDPAGHLLSVGTAKAGGGHTGDYTSGLHERVTRGGYTSGLHGVRGLHDNGI